MNQVITFWDYVTIVSAMIFVVVFSAIKIRAMLQPSSGGCGSCSGGAGEACSAPLTKKRHENENKVHMVSVASIQKNPKIT